MATREFVVGARRQQEWNWRIILGLFFSGTGSASFLISAILGDLVRMAVGVVVVLVGGLFLMSDLTRPLHAWRAFLRPQTSWVSRGIIGIMGFALLGAVYIILLALQPKGLTSLGAPWSGGPAWAWVYGVVVIAAAIFVASYPGFLLGGMRPIALWNTAYLPALFLVSALVSGLGDIYLVPSNGTPAILQNLSIGVIVLGFFLFFTAGCAEINRSPFDLMEADSEIVAGFHTEYSGMKFAMFYLLEYAEAVAISAIVTTLFLGGWRGPVLPPWLWFFIKIGAVFFVILWIRTTVPRVRIDQLMALAWKFLFPLALLNLIITGIQVLVWPEALPWVMILVNIAIMVILVLLWSRFFKLGWGRVEV